MKRRTLVLGTVSAAAATIGAGTALWRARRNDGSPSEAPNVWAMSFVTLDGPPLAMRGLRGKRLLINFWATWCPPCVTEMPLLDSFARDQSDAGWNVLALAVDSAEAVRRFIAERGLHLPVALAGDDGLDLSRRLGNGAGGLPFSVAFDPGGAMAQRKLGAVDADLLRKWVATTP